jgi:hypothetical protein
MGVWRKNAPPGFSGLRLSPPTKRFAFVFATLTLTIPNAGFLSCYINELKLESLSGKSLKMIF